MKAVEVLVHRAEHYNRFVLIQVPDDYHNEQIEGIARQLYEDGRIELEEAGIEDYGAEVHNPTDESQTL